jgi:hypothetical protein
MCGTVHDCIEKIYFVQIFNHPFIFFTTDFEPKFFKNMAKSTFFFPSLLAIKNFPHFRNSNFSFSFLAKFCQFLKKSELASVLFSKKGAGSTFFQKGHT